MIGHGIGVELNEPPVLSEYEASAVADRCVVALDMHMLDRAVGAVKLEDMVLVTRSGNEILTQSPRELFEL